MRFSVYEIIMFLAIFALVAFFATPRVIQGSPEVRASQAVALQLELEKTQEKWKAAGGLHGRGENDNIKLTQNLIQCFTSPIHTPYASEAPDLLEFSGSWVYEKPSLYPNPSEIRLSGLSSSNMKRASLVLPDGRACPGLLLENTFVVLFDGQRWLVSPVQ